MEYVITRAVWLADIASNFLPYMAVVFAVAFIVAAMRRARVALVGSAIGLIAALSPVLRDVNVAQAGAGSAAEIAAAPQLRLMTFNVEDINENYTEVMDYLVNSPVDVIFLNEAFYVWRRRLVQLAPEFPWNTILTERDLIVLSRIPLEKIEFVNLVGDPGRALLAHARLGDRTVALIGVHARKPRHAADFELRSRQLAQIGQLVDSQNGPVVVAGDFNATAYSFSMHAFLKSTGLAPSGWRWPPLATWPSWLPYFGLQIDHVLTRGAIAVVHAEAGPDLGSNHRPLIADLRLGASSLRSRNP